MAFFRGIDGFIAVGGALVGAPTVNGALTAGAVTLNIDVASGVLLGVVAAGDTFTIAGELGSPVHTVTNPVPVVAATNAIAGVTFTPAIATGGTLTGAVMTFASNALPQATGWDLDIQIKDLETTSLGDKWRSSVTEIASWSGSLAMRLDYSLPAQAAVFNRLSGATPGGILGTIVLGVGQGATTFKAAVGAAEFKSAALKNQIGAILDVKVAFTGTGQLSLLWT
jgi:hypothetical protein